MTQYLKFAAPVLCAVLAFLLWGALKDLSEARQDNRDLRAEVSAAYANIDLWEEAVSDRDETIRSQNASIEGWKASAERQRVAYLSALEDARRASQVDRGRAADLLALQAPDGELAQCRAARDLLEAELVQ